MSEQCMLFRRPRSPALIRTLRRSMAAFAFLSVVSVTAAAESYGPTPEQGALARLNVATGSSEPIGNECVGDACAPFNLDNPTVLNIALGLVNNYSTSVGSTIYIYWYKGPGAGNGSCLEYWRYWTVLEKPAVDKYSFGYISSYCLNKVDLPLE